MKLFESEEEVAQRREWRRMVVEDGRWRVKQERLEKWRRLKEEEEWSTWRWREDQMRRWKEKEEEEDRRLKKGGEKPKEKGEKDKEWCG